MPSIWTILPPTISALAALFGFLLTLILWRESSLRRDDVLVWAKESIVELQTLLLICMEYYKREADPETSERLRSINTRTSILIEQGRLFFRNKPYGNFGIEKEPAYRGLRPRILDSLVLANKISNHFLTADRESRARMRLLAEDCLKRFVSMAQKEVGRNRVRSADASHGGDGSDLWQWLKAIDTKRLNKLLGDQSEAEG